jgi:hypothetical protein
MQQILLDTNALIALSDPTLPRLTSEATICPRLPLEFTFPRVEPHARFRRSLKPRRSQVFDLIRSSLLDAE